MSGAVIPKGEGIAFGETHNKRYDAAAPSKRTRWATQKVKGGRGSQKRASILDRFHKGSSEKKRDSGMAESMATDLDDLPEQGAEGDEDEEEEDNSRKVYVNQDLPKEELDEDGKPIVEFVRNKVRTAKYTPLSFLPKNLFFQFQNIANDYFLFVIVLGVSFVGSCQCAEHGLIISSSFQSLAPQIQD
jgi:phospholipid-translocating ATPase